jgi:hypothetical protein
VGGLFHFKDPPPRKLTKFNEVFTWLCELAHEHFVCPARYSAQIKTVCEVEMFKEVSDQTVFALAPLFGPVFLGLMTARRRSSRRQVAAQAKVG